MRFSAPTTATPAAVHQADSVRGTPVPAACPFGQLSEVSSGTGPQAGPSRKIAAISPCRGEESPGVDPDPAGVVPLVEVPAAGHDLYRRGVAVQLLPAGVGCAGVDPDPA